MLLSLIFLFAIDVEPVQTQNDAQEIRLVGRPFDSAGHLVIDASLQCPNARFQIKLVQSAETGPLIKSIKSNGKPAADKLKRKANATLKSKSAASAYISHMQCKARGMEFALSGSYAKPDRGEDDDFTLVYNVTLPQFR